MSFDAADREREPALLLMRCARRAFRTRLAHGHPGVDLALVEDVIQHDLPPLRAAVETEMRARG